MVHVTHHNFTANMELKETGAFSLMDLRSEEAEHSIEMQLPYIAKIMEKYIFCWIKITVSFQDRTDKLKLG